MLRDLRGEKGLAKHLYRVARRLEKQDFKEIEKVEEELENAENIKNLDLIEDSVEDLAKHSEKAIKHLIEIENSEFKIEYDHILAIKRTVKNIRSLLPEFEEKMGERYDEKTREKVKEILASLREVLEEIDEKSKIDNYVAELARLEKGETPKNVDWGKMEDEYTLAREIRDYAKQIRRGESKVQKLEKEMEKEPKHLSQDNELIGFFQEMKKLIKKLKSLEDKLKGKHNKMMLYDMFDLHFIMTESKKIVEYCEEESGYPNNSLEEIRKIVTSINKEVREEAHNMLNEARTLLSEEEEVKQLLGG